VSLHFDLNILEPSEPLFFDETDQHVLDFALIFQRSDEGLSAVFRQLGNRREAVFLMELVVSFVLSLRND
jgi:hypothetical protein